MILETDPTDDTDGALPMNCRRAASLPTLPEDERTSSRSRFGEQFDQNASGLFGPPHLLELRDRYERLKPIEFIAAQARRHFIDGDLAGFEQLEDVAYVCRGRCPHLHGYERHGSKHRQSRALCRAQEVRSMQRLGDHHELHLVSSTLTNMAFSCPRMGVVAPRCSMVFRALRGTTNSAAFPVQRLKP